MSVKHADESREKSQTRVFCSGFLSRSVVGVFPFKRVVRGHSWTSSCKAALEVTGRKQEMDIDGRKPLYPWRVASKAEAFNRLNYQVVRDIVGQR